MIERNTPIRTVTYGTASGSYIHPDKEKVNAKQDVEDLATWLDTGALAVLSEDTQATCTASHIIANRLEVIDFLQSFDKIKDVRMSIDGPGRVSFVTDDELLVNWRDIQPGLNFAFMSRTGDWFASAIEPGLGGENWAHVDSDRLHTITQGMSEYPPELWAKSLQARHAHKLPEVKEPWERVDWSAIPKGMNFIFMGPTGLWYTSALRPEVGLDGWTVMGDLQYTEQGAISCSRRDWKSSLQERPGA